MQNLKKYSIIAILTLSVVAGIFNNIPSYAQEGNQTTTTMEETATPMTNQTQTAAAEETEEQHATEAAGHASGEEEEKEYSKTDTVRDSVTVLLQDRIIPATDFIHLYDSTPYHIMNGHVALKAPCEDDSTSLITVLIGSAPNMTAATLENIPSLSNPGEQCLYHVDLIPAGNVTTITDIALSNPSDEDIEFPPSATVVIGINEVTKGEHGGEHSESTEQAATNTAAAAAEAGHTE
jgi:hypothetical protein